MLLQVFLVQGSETMCTQLGKIALFTQQELLMVELGPTVSFTFGQLYTFLQLLKWFKLIENSLYKIENTLYMISLF